MRVHELIDALSQERPEAFVEVPVSVQGTGPLTTVTAFDCGIEHGVVILEGGDKE